jgi:hypothetical protein
MPAGNNRIGFTRIVPVTGQDGNRQLLADSEKINLVRDSLTGTETDPRGTDSVHREEYCVFATDVGDALTGNEVAELCEYEDTCFVKVLVGRASIRYSITEKALRNGMSRYTVRLVSDAEIREGIIGYRFRVAGQVFVQALPGDIPIGRHMRYRPIILPRGAPPEPVVLADARGEQIRISVPESLIEKIKFKFNL